MLYIQTAFETSRKIKPLASLIFDSNSGRIEFCPLYSKETGCQVSAAFKKCKIVSELFKREITVSDFKSHIKALDLSLTDDYNVHEVPIEEQQWPTGLDELKVALIKQLAAVRRQPSGLAWQRIAANATLVYEALERRGLLANGIETHPIWEINTFSGRSKTSGFSVQGMGDGKDIMPIQRDYEIFVCADWIAADMRIASLMSDDEVMQSTFIESDPYTYLANRIGDVSRSDCKLNLLRGVNALDVDSPVLELYPKLKHWITTSIRRMESDGYLESILRRRFYFDGSNHKTVFNATVQGSVAHAMQNAITQIHRRLPQCLLAEVHDSVILCCRPDMLKTVINIIKEAMLHPFAGVLDTNPTFPIEVSVGNKWRNWKLYKEFRV